MRKDRSLEQRSRFSRTTSPSTVNPNVLGFSTFPPTVLNYAISDIISVYMAFEGYCLFPSAMSPGKSSIKSRRRPFPAFVMQSHFGHSLSFIPRRSFGIETIRSVIHTMHTANQPIPHSPARSLFSVGAVAAWEICHADGSPCCRFYWVGR